MELKFKQKNLQLMFNRPSFFVIFTKGVILKYFWTVLIPMASFLQDFDDIFFVDISDSLVTFAALPA